MQRYVAGLAFLGKTQEVLLVRKRVPLWQENLLNAVGGKIEDGETPGQAMAREFREETGVEVEEGRLSCFCVESRVDYEVHFFKASLTTNEANLTHPINDVKEMLIWCHTYEVLRGSDLEDCNCVGNLLWLIPMAMDWRDFQARLTVRDNISERPTWPCAA